MLIVTDLLKLQRVDSDATTSSPSMPHWRTIPRHCFYQHVNRGFFRVIPLRQ